MFAVYKIVILVVFRKVSWEESTCIFACTVINEKIQLYLVYVNTMQLLLFDWRPLLIIRIRLKVSFTLQKKNINIQFCVTMYKRYNIVIFVCAQIDLWSLWRWRDCYKGKPEGKHCVPSSKEKKPFHRCWRTVIEVSELCCARSWCGTYEDRIFD